MWVKIESWAVLTETWIQFKIESKFLFNLFLNYIFFPPSSFPLFHPPVLPSLLPPPSFLDSFIHSLSREFGCSWSTDLSERNTVLTHQILILRTQTRPFQETIATDERKSALTLRSVSSPLGGGTQQGWATVTSSPAFTLRKLFPNQI